MYLGRLSRILEGWRTIIKDVVQLTKVERALLLNLVETRRENDAAWPEHDYRLCTRVLTEGWQRNYSEVLDKLGIHDDVSSEGSEYASRVLHMYRTMQSVCERDDLVFPGFTDTEHQSYAEFLHDIGDLGGRNGVTPLKVKRTDFRAELGEEPNYQAMLECAGGPLRVTPERVETILEAGRRDRVKAP